MASSDLDPLILDHLTLASHLARTFSGRGVDSEDLEQVARLALVKAAQGYDDDRGAFAPFATATIRGEIKRYFRDVAWDVRIPRRLQELQARINRERAERPDDVTPVGIATRLEADLDDVREAMAARGCFTCDSTDAAEQTGHHLGRTDGRLEAVEEWVTFSQLCRHLGDADRTLLQWRFVDELPQREIGLRLGISQMQVSRRLSALVGRLREQVLDPAA